MRDIESAFEILYGMNLYESQRKAIKEMLRGYFIEVPTGGGKTVIGLISACAYAKMGHKVSMVFPNRALALRDFEYGAKLFDALGLRVLLRKENEIAGGLDYSDYDIVYASAEVFVFDFFKGVNNPFDVAILDEADFTLIECAGSIMSVGSRFLSNPDENKVKFALGIFEGLEGVELDYTAPFYDKTYYDYLYDYTYCKRNRAVNLTNRGIDRVSVYGLDFIPLVSSVIEASKVLEEDVDYQVANGRVCTINRFNGRASFSSRFDSDVQTVLELMHGVAITGESLLSYKMTFPVFFSKYKDIVGMSATMTSYRDVLEEIWFKGVRRIASGVPSSIREEKDAIFIKSDERDLAVIEKISSLGRTPVLCITPDDVRAKKFHTLCVQHGLSAQLLVNDNITEEVDIISEAGKWGSVTVSTPILGRGTDINDESGALAVFLIGRGRLSAIDTQVKGRTARNGKGGTVYPYISLEDDIFEGANLKDFFAVRRRGILREFGAGDFFPVDEVSDDSRYIKSRAVRKFIKNRQRANALNNAGSLFNMFMLERMIEVNRLAYRRAVGLDGDFRFDIECLSGLNPRVAEHLSEYAFDVLWLPLAEDCRFTYRVTFGEEVFRNLLKKFRDYESVFTREYISLVTEARGSMAEIKIPKSELSGTVYS